MKLHVLMNGMATGACTADRDGRYRFVYAPEWLARADAIPVSLSLPLNKGEHAPETVAAVLWGLLPDNELTLQRWASRFHVSARNPLALLAHVGEDCAGALQFVVEDKLDAVFSGRGDSVQWLSEAQIADRLRRLRKDGSAARRPDDIGQFSLAGAQPKAAFLHEQGRWGVPAGRIPTTHILKPPGDDYEDYAENEHFCLRLAHAVGLPVCKSSIRRFEDQIAIVVERYDRLYADGRWWRVHQEDMCQALGVMPHRKYQNAGGPGPADIADLLRRCSGARETDLAAFLHALAFNWLIAGADAHAKNYSVLLSGGGKVRMAPLYDISSALPYPELQRRKLKMAMKIGGRYRWWEVTRADWLHTASAMRIDPDFVVRSLVAMIGVLPDLAVGIGEDMQRQGIHRKVIARLVDGIAESCAHGRRRILGE